MDQLFNLHTLIEIILGISLSAASGFRVFVPLLALSTAAVVGHIDLPTSFDWIESPQAFAVFAVACALEIAGYYIPWFDHLLDVAATPAAILAGTVVTASLAPDMNPLVQWTLAVVAGGGTAGITKGLMNLVRATSTATSGGLANPVVATVELGAAIVLSVLALTLPVIAGIVVIALLVFAISKLLQFFSRLKLRQDSVDDLPQ
ncbi:DUF4126 domain-containing protein [Chroococcidiopsis sp. CCMEE 29]|uniref:DUF4126 domain-containing protein n=1 Tax=Chroococcidiopsis sp. CCMEE 29 TaxID=155894 RepID=UPI0020220172|nr:DUF4126 domain-containing protein [Chroococcidiopsis sp. CCMEE 29]